MNKKLIEIKFDHDLINGCLKVRKKCLEIFGDAALQDADLIIL